MVSPFSIEAVDVLDQIGVKTLKIASGEVTNLPLLDRINATEYSVILSTGMASYQEIDQAIETLSEVKKLSILQCTSAYPCPLENTFASHEKLQEMYPHARIGFSDHTSGLTAGVVAVTMGAELIEKHFSFSRIMYGSDASLVLNPTSSEAL